MNKSLSEMTLEELWELFPIILSEHKSCWKDWYDEEKQEMADILCDNDFRIHHIGSTAIDHIWAKPIVDILLEIPRSISMEDIKEKLVKSGYICMSEEENRKSFNKGYTDKGFANRVFHIHLRYDGDNDELYFRDYMNSHPELAKEYEELKISLWKKYEHNRDAYTDAKSAFVKRYTECAKADYRNQYGLIENAIKYAKEIFANDYSGHDYFHTIRVYRLAMKIAEAEEADMQIVQLAAILHDVDDRKLSPETYEKKENAVKFLKSNGLDETIIAQICKIIDDVSFAGTDSVVPDTIEGKCVQDADRLDAMGAIGIARTFAYGGSKGRNIYDPDVKPLTAMSKEEYHQNRCQTSINHFYEKLLLLKDMMNTETARKIAEHRQIVMEEYLAEFAAEWDGER